MANELTDLVIEEVSLVTEPANPDAVITLVKAFNEEEKMSETVDTAVDPAVELEKNLGEVAQAALDAPVPSALVDDAEDMEKALVLNKIKALEETVQAYKRKERLQEIAKYVAERWAKVPEGAIYLYEKCWDDEKAMAALQAISNQNNKRYAKMVGRGDGSARTVITTGNKALDALEIKIAESMAKGLTRKQAIAGLSVEDRQAFFAAIN